MKELASYAQLLSKLPWKIEEGKEVLLNAARLRKRKELAALIGSVTGTEPADLTLELVRDLDYQARHQVRVDDVAAAEKLWALARLVEYLLSLNQRPICRFCYRSVGLRSNGRLKDFCPHHASGMDAGHAAEYQRARKRQHALDRLLQLLPSSEDFAQALLEYQLNSLRLKGGVAGRIVSKFDFNGFIDGKLFKIPPSQSISDDEWTGLMENRYERLRQLNEAAGGELRWRFSKAELMLDDLTQDSPDWTELAMRWRARFDDLEGLQKLKDGAEGAVTPLLLMEQWLKWKAWSVVGDETVQIRRGRPAKIDREGAIKMRGEGKTDAEIAAKYDVSKKSVGVFFSRLKKSASLTP
jgi:hypothetical protein